MIARTMRSDGKPVRPGIGKTRFMSRASQPAKQSGTRSTETIKASGHMHRINRPDTRLYPTKRPALQKVLASREPSTQDVTHHVN